MGQRTVIVGAGGMGREAAAWALDADPDRELIGFLDDDAAIHGTTVAGAPVLGNPEQLPELGDIEVIVAIGNPAARQLVIKRVDDVGLALARIVHPSAVIGPRVTIADGAIICPGVVLTCDIRIERAAILNYGALVGHDGVIGPSAFIAPGVNLGGNVTVGALADVGIGASVIQGRTIGERAVVGAGAVVIRDVPDDTTVVGVPAAPLRRGAAG